MGVMIIWLTKSAQGGTNSSRSWGPFCIGLPEDISVYDLLITPVAPTILYAGSDEGIFICIDGGDWESIGKPAWIVTTLSWIPRSSSSSDVRLGFECASGGEASAATAFP